MCLGVYRCLTYLDLLGDFVTLFAWKWTQKPPSKKYPYSFGKFETLYTISISILLTGGALSISFHSYNPLIDMLSPTISTMPPEIVQCAFQAIQNFPVPKIGHVHIHTTSGHDSHEQGLVLDPNASCVVCHPRGIVQGMVVQNYQEGHL